MDSQNCYSFLPKAPSFPSSDFSKRHDTTLPPIGGGHKSTGGYRAILADTLPTMERALALYAQTWFVTIPPYAANPTPGTICLRLDL